MALSTDIGNQQLARCPKYINIQDKGNALLSISD